MTVSLAKPARGTAPAGDRDVVGPVTLRQPCGQTGAQSAVVGGCPPRRHVPVTGRPPRGECISGPAPVARGRCAAGSPGHRVLRVVPRRSGDPGGDEMGEGRGRQGTTATGTGGPMRLRSSYVQPGAAGYRRPGGAWDVPGLDRLLGSPRQRPASCGGRRGRVVLDHATLDALASSVAGGLRALGVRHRDVVAWQLPNWWEAVVLFHACWRMRCRGGPDPPPGRVGRGRAGSWGSWTPASSWPAVGMPLADAPGPRPVIGVRTGDPRFDALLSGRPAGRRHRPGPTWQ